MCLLCLNMIQLWKTSHHVVSEFHNNKFMSDMRGSVDRKYQLRYGGFGSYYKVHRHFELKVNIATSGRWYVFNGKRQIIEPLMDFYFYRRLPPSRLIED